LVSLLNAARRSGSLTGVPVTNAKYQTFGKNARANPA
jgi:hypothetical protein